VNNEKIVECNLDSADKLVTESAKHFLEALKGFEKYDGERIVEAFLTPFANRSEVTRSIQLEAERAIKQFTSVCASLASDVNIAMMWLSGTVMGIQTFVISEGLHVFDAPPGDAELSVTERFFARHKHMNERHEEFKKKVEWARTSACKVARNVEKVNLMAADVIEIHSTTLRVFKKEKVGTSFQDLLKKIEEREYREAGTELLKAIGERLWEVTKELGAIVMEEEPISALLDKMKRLGKAIKGKSRLDTTPGGTEGLNELVSQLRREADLLKEIEKEYQAAMNEFDTVTAMLKFS
jgi:hypothetical protein